MKVQKFRQQYKLKSFLGYKIIHPLKSSVHTRLREYHLKKLLTKKSGGRLLDVGCGLGYLTEVLSGSLLGVGIDSDIQSLKSNRQRGLERMTRASATDLPFKDQSFEVIVCSEVLEHLPRKLDQQALEEMARVLKPGGRLLITVPSLEGWRAHSKIRNIGHEDRKSGEYHYRIGYSWEEIREIINRLQSLRIVKRKYTMFLISELFMDLQKWVFLKKHYLKEQSDIMEASRSALFTAYRLAFPFLHILFVAEALVFCPFFKGHILILALDKPRTAEA